MWRCKGVRKTVVFLICNRNMTGGQFSPFCLCCSLSSDVFSEHSEVLVGKTNGNRAASLEVPSR